MHINLGPLTTHGEFDWLRCKSGCRLYHESELSVQCPHTFVHLSEAVAVQLCPVHGGERFGKAEARSSLEKRESYST